MKKKLRRKGEHNLRYNLKKWGKRGAFDILNEFSEHFTFLKLIDTLGNVYHDISIVGYCIFESNYEHTLFLKIESLDLIFSPSICKEQVLNFETVFYAVKYMWAPGNLNIG